MYVSITHHENKMPEENNKEINSIDYFLSSPARYSINSYEDRYRRQPKPESKKMALWDPKEILQDIYMLCWTVHWLQQKSIALFQLFIRVGYF